ncbi:hypothetical protein IFM89_022805 [Coptis chinensis]|uniref:F-box associated beta-propeller type 3 domain-containing protein n=1 Tax=Coptis chinensis TaxID=261450 RepID=A0A835LWV8_9MAGN|nr:hypothetical protein IFM89_022805 [Coptis chinensis]
MLYNTNELFMRTKLEQAELQQAMELHSRKLMGLHLFDGNKHHRRNLSIGTGSVPSPIHSHTYVNQNFMIPTSSPGQSSPMTQIDNCAVNCATSLSLSTIDDNVSKPQTELDRGDKDTEENSKHGDNNTHVRVDVETLTEVRWACKACLEEIKEDERAMVNIYEAKLPTPLRQIHSCHGLVFSCRPPYFVSNPITGEHGVVPKPPMSELEALVTGFGYDSVYEVFKVIRILEVLEGNKCCTSAEVFNFGYGKWRCIRKVQYNYNKKNVNVFLNGALHWIGSPCENRDSDVIISFNLDTEEFHPLPLPKFCLGTENFSLYLSVLGGRLHLVHTLNRKHIKVWVMKKGNSAHQGGLLGIAKKALARKGIELKHRLSNITNSKSQLAALAMGIRLSNHLRPPFRLRLLSQQTQLRVPNQPFGLRRASKKNPVHDSSMTSALTNPVGGPENEGCVAVVSNDGGPMNVKKIKNTGPGPTQGQGRGRGRNRS